MPSLKQHCAISKKITGKDYKDLHEWVDGPQKELGINHRTERHNTSYIPFIREKWGVEGVKEFLRHIEEDYRYTREKWGSGCVTEGCKNATWHRNKYCNKCKGKMKNG